MPKINVMPFEQLAPGDLFVFENNGTCYVGIAAIDYLGSGGKLILPLGPEFNGAFGPARLLSWKAVAVMSFGKDYFVQLPSEPDGWTTQPPADDVVALAMRDKQLYVRALHSPHGTDRHCLVKLSDGSILHGWSGGAIAFAARWEIVLLDPANPSRLFLKLGCRT